MAEFVQNLFNGSVLSSTYLLVALGLTLVFGLTRLINFAHGQFLVLGAFISYTVRSHGYPFVVAMMASLIAVGILAYLCERFLFRRSLANPLTGLVISLGLLTTLEALTAIIWGPDDITSGLPIRGEVTVFGAVLSMTRLLVLAVTAVATVLTLVIVRRTKVGRQLRAANDNPMAAEHIGVPVSRMITFAFVGGSVLAALGGVLLNTLQPIGPSDGGVYIISGFAVALLGGLGSITGAIYASLIFGLSTTFLSAYVNPAWVSLFTFGTVILVLTLRPGGLWGPTGEHQTAVNFLVQSDTPRPEWPVRKVLVGILLSVAAAVGIFALLPSARLQDVFLLAAIFTVVVYSVSLLFHHVGIVSMAHAGLMGIGAFTSVYLTDRFGWSIWATLPLCFLLCAVVGAAIAYPAARARGHYVILVTFAFGSLIVAIGNQWQSVTGGDFGKFTLTPLSPIGPLKFTSLGAFFYLALAFAVLAAGAVVFIARSNFGRRLHAIRDNEQLAEALGLKVIAYKVVVFSISGGIAGIGGAIFLYQEHVVTPDVFGLTLALDFLAVLVLGGFSLLGPPIGVFVIVVVPTLLGLSAVDNELVTGLILMAVMLTMKDGIVPNAVAGGLWASRSVSRVLTGVAKAPQPISTFKTKEESGTH
jgi:branched-chain amino acid transport system permease protein